MVVGVLVRIPAVGERGMPVTAVKLLDQDRIAMDLNPIQVTDPSRTTPIVNSVSKRTCGAVVVQVSRLIARNLAGDRLAS